MQNGIRVSVTKLRKAQRCGGLANHEVLLHYALGQPVLIDTHPFAEGKLLQDVKAGGRVELGVDGNGVRYCSETIIEIEDDVLLTRRGFYRVTVITGGLDWRSRFHWAPGEGLLSGRDMISLFSRTGYPLWMQLVVSRFPKIFLTPNPNIFDNPVPEVAAISPKDRVNLRYGLECKEGYAGLIEEIAATATELVNVLHDSGIQPCAWIHSRIVKQKMGRLVWSGDQDLMEPFGTLFRGYVASVCAKSTSVCEVCGRYGKLREINGWLETLCDEEYARRTKPRRPPHE
jgi:hypothetical protein